MRRAAAPATDEVECRRLVHAQSGLTDDHRLLRALAHHDRRRVGERGRAACFGFYARVEQPGEVAEGDTVRVL